jgi:anti-sigma B factor antagonist
MECRIETLTDCIVIAPVGRIDGSTVASFMESVLAAIRNGTLPVVIDMRGVPFMNSAGLRVLLIAQRELARRDQRVSLRAPCPAVDELLRVAGLDMLLEVRP